MSFQAQVTSGSVVCLLVVLATAKIPMNAKITKLTCTNYDKELISDLVCSTKPINRNITVVNVLGHLARPVNDIMAHLKLYKMVNVYKPFLVDVKENFCEMMLGKLNAVYLRLLYMMMEPYTNFNHTCPYTGAIIFKDFELNLNNVRQVRDAWPPGHYRLDVIVYFNKRPSPTVKMQYDVTYEEKYLIGK